MSFVPLVPFAGAVGWSFLQRPRVAQQETHSAAPAMHRDAARFAEKIPATATAEELVGDRRLLTVALGAFGLEGDVNNRFFIRKILESDTLDPRSLVNRLSDKRYLAMTRAFGFGDAGGPRTADPGFARRITAAWQDRSFEVAVGEQNADLRLVMGLSRDLGAVTGRSGLSDNAAWYTIMATPPLRSVFERALGLPKSFGALPLDRQLNEFRARSERILGASEVSQLGTPEKIEELTRLFLVRSDIAGSGASLSGSSAALSILQAPLRF